ncbi:hypothetical protein NFI96_008606 [Prochilodus magdalenae]|nr:hypothetical protein NFI96_008606 [Prochilodus magdalenae]
MAGYTAPLQWAIDNSWGGICRLCGERLLKCKCVVCFPITLFTFTSCVSHLEVFGILSPPTGLRWEGVLMGMEVFGILSPPTGLRWEGVLMGMEVFGILSPPTGLRWEGVLMGMEVLTTSSDYFEYTEDDDLAAPCSLNETWRFIRQFVPVAYFLVFILALVGNVLVLCVVRRYRRFRHSPCSFSLTDTFLLHLAVSDLLLALTLPFFAVQWTHEWMFGLGVCKVAGALFSLNIYCGVLFLACISFDRYLAIVHAVQTGWRHNTCLAQVACGTIWVCCLGLSAVDIQFRKVVPLQGTGPLVCLVEYSSESSEKWQLAMQLLNLTLGFGLPLLVMLYCYIRIFRALCSTSSRRQKRRSLRLIITLVAVFLVCWAPYNILKMTDSLLMLKLIHGSCSLNHVLDIGIMVTESLGLSHCAFNPLLYGLVGVKFRRELTQMCKVVLGCLGLPRWTQRQGSSRRTTGSFSSVDSDNTSYFSVMA